MRATGRDPTRSAGTRRRLAGRQAPGPSGVWEIYLSPTWLPALLVADELGVLQSIADVPGRPDELAARLGLNGRALGSVLALLASLGYLVPRAGRYHVTDATRHH
jgi:hypothetical protein